MTELERLNVQAPMKMRLFLTLIFLGFVLHGSLTHRASAQGDRTVSARDALDLVAQQFGSEQTRWIVEMRGYEGIPDPKEWQIWVWDQRTPLMVRELWASRTRATNEGASEDYYPRRSPFGFVRLADLKLDSKAAFVIAEAEARKAKMGFDSLNYILRCREFSREPIWTLELIDAAGDIVGKVYISGATGELLRTVWIYRGSRGRPGGIPLIVDSSSPREGADDAPESRGSISSTSAPTSGESTGVPGETLPGGLPPMPAPFREPDPLSPQGPATGTVVPSPNSPPLKKPPLPPSTGSSSGNVDTLIPPPPLPPEP